MIDEYLPTPLTEAEVADVVDTAIAQVAEELGERPGMKQMGMVMKAATAIAAGKADGSRLSAAVKARAAPAVSRTWFLGIRDLRAVTTTVIMASEGRQMMIAYTPPSASLDIDGVYPPQHDSQLLIDSWSRPNWRRGGGYWTSVREAASSRSPPPNWVPPA